MEEKKNYLDALKLGNELITRRYLFGKIRVSKAMSVPDYIAMRIIMNTENPEDIYDGKTYLTDIAEKMQITLRQTSRMIGRLKERGLVSWEHDGNGSEGTYVTVTADGRELFLQQEKVLKEFYGHVIERFGADNLVQLLNLMKQLETHMESEIEKMEVHFDDDDE